MRLLATILLIVLCISPSFAAKQHLKRHHANGIGITYDQAMNYLSDHANMEKSSPVDGRERWLGQSDNKVCVLEIIGQHSNIYEATLIVGTPNDISIDDKAMNAGMMVRFMKNISPGWNDAIDWMNDAANAVIGGGSGAKRTTVHNGRRYEITNVSPMGLCISVKPA